MRIGFDERVGDVGRVRVAGDAVDGRAQPRLLALRAARVDQPGIVDAGGEHERRESPASPHHRGGQATGRSSRMRWLTTRLEPPGGIDTP